MAQVDSENSTAMPARPAGATNPAGLARQQREREKVLKRLAKLRTRAADEIDRLLAFLDASDPYAATELEDDGPDDDLSDLEPSLCGLTASCGRQNGGAGDDLEADRSDDEPSLGSVDGPEWGGQMHWAQGARGDLEESCDDEGVAA
jgi:hypothetical protein